MSKRTNFNTLFNKMFVVIMLSILIPIAILGILSFEKSKEQIEAVTSQFLQDNLGLNAKQISKILSNVEEESHRLSRSTQMKEWLQNGSPAISQIYSPFSISVISPNDGAYVLLANRIKDSYKPGVWVHEWNKEQSRPIFSYASIIRDSHSDILGILVVQIPEKLVRDELAFPSSFQEYTLVLADSENHIISHPNPEFYNKKYYYEEYFPAADWKKGEIQLNKDGWKLIAAVPHIELTGKINQIKDFTVWIVLIGMIVVTLILFVLVRTFTIPIKNLVLHMDGVKKGLLHPFPLYHQRQDEIGQLVQGYNQMVSGMSDLLEQTITMESDKRQLEIQTLNYQINPHFFYNTLDAIKWRAEQSNEMTIAVMVRKLANLLRFSLNNGEEWTTVEREIEHARNYLDIELVRSNRSFQVFIQIAPDIRKRKIIKLILQPIMENAVKHGISKLPEGKGKIKLTAKRKGDEIIFVVEDNGPGLKSEQSLKLHTESKKERSGGIGLANVHKRLQLHFGQSYGVSVLPKHDAGFRVEVRHPIVEAQRDGRSEENDSSV